MYRPFFPLLLRLRLSPFSFFYSSVVIVAPLFVWYWRCETVSSLFYLEIFLPMILFALYFLFIFFFAALYLDLWVFAFKPSIISCKYWFFLLALFVGGSFHISGWLFFFFLMSIWGNATCLLSFSSVSREPAFGLACPVNELQNIVPSVFS